MFNPTKLIKLKNAWKIFSDNHPKFSKFLNAVNKNAIEEGTIIEINVKTKDGKEINSNIKLKESDIELFQELTGMFRSL